MMDLEWIRRLLELVDESDVDTLEIRRFGTHVRISKSPPVAEGGSVVRTAPPGGASAAPAAGGGGGAPAPPAKAGPAPEAEQEGSEDEGSGGEDLFEVHSPMVGTFYRSPAPDAPPYVEVGDRVGKGQTLCILEAMKLMNELESEVAGVVREISVENSEPVEYGQVLFRIEADGKG